MNKITNILFTLLASHTLCVAQNKDVELHRTLADSSRVTAVSIGVLSEVDTLQGVQFSLFSNMVESMKGIQLTSFSNMSTTPFQGIQLSGFSNFSLGVKKGIQVSSLLNVSSSYMRGLQAAAYNYADSLNGTQLGIINVAHTHPRGWQVGIINYTHDSVAHKIGLVNVNPNTTIDLMVYGGTSTKGNAAVRFRNRSTYNIIGIGTHYMGLDEKFSGALFYRIGQYFPLSPHLTISGDVGFYHVETFEQHSLDKPERLFSLQARVNADYQVNSHIGAFATIGYGDTRYYHHASSYRHRLLAEAGITFRFNRQGSASAWWEARHKAVALDAPPRLTASMAVKRPWLAAMETLGINLLVHGFDRFVMNEEFAQVNLHTIHNNFKKGFVWDNDQFSTNLFAHPYHGNLYYNTARSNGLSFWQSAPYSLCGSLMWEFFGEIEPPAINDLMATTAGGICIGEITHRISDIILNDRSIGFRRFLREAAATIVNPMKGLNRIISGKAWRVSAIGNEPRRAFPLDFSLSLGSRYLADDGGMFRGEHNPYLNMYLEYGDPLNTNGEKHPYDFFDAEVTFGLSSNQPLINALHLMGRIWASPTIERKGAKMEIGVYQHFNYFDSKPVKDGTNLTPYRISEAAAAGPGIIFSFPEVGSLSSFEQRLFLSGILLGGTKSDYYNVIDRDYNMGSGFSVKSKTHMEMRHFGRFILNVHYYAIYTWKGYENKDLSTVNPLYLNAQGDKGNARLLVVSPMCEMDLKGPWGIIISGSYFSRKTHYKYYDDVAARTFELKAGIVCHF
ncbi:MAG: DUF3943 domain-containing protein [Prevotella sp.]|nr:DUF3943 domain-containing protein [Prevotella sp.]